MKQILLSLLLIVSHPIAFANGKLSSLKRRSEFNYATIDLSRTLLVISNLETRMNPKLIGAAGEKTAYQMTRAVWEENTSRPWSLAGKDPSLDHKVAMSHLMKLVMRIRKSDPPRDRIEFVFAAWRYGFGHAFTHGDSDYATRGANLYFDKEL